MKTITISDRAYQILNSFANNELVDKELDCEYFETEKEAEDNARAFVELYKVFGVSNDFEKASIIERDCNGTALYYAVFESKVIDYLGDDETLVNTIHFEK